VSPIVLEDVTVDVEEIYIQGTLWARISAKIPLEPFLVNFQNRMLHNRGLVRLALQIIMLSERMRKGSGCASISILMGDRTIKILLSS